MFRTLMQLGPDKAQQLPRGQRGTIGAVLRAPGRQARIALRQAYALVGLWIAETVVSGASHRFNLADGA